MLIVALTHLYSCHISTMYLPHHNFFINKAALHAQKLQIRLFGVSEHNRTALAAQFNNYTQQLINICI